MLGASRAWEVILVFQKSRKTGLGCKISSVWKSTSIRLKITWNVGEPPAAGRLCSLSKSPAKYPRQTVPLVWKAPQLDKQLFGMLGAPEAGRLCSLSKCPSKRDFSCGNIAKRGLLNVDF